MTDPSVAGERLRRKLEQSAEIAGCTLDVVTGDSRDLSVSIFTCAQHWLTVIVGGDNARWWLDQLDEHSVCVPGYVLAQLAIGAIEEKDGQLLAEIEAQTAKEA
ncbi:hypothetical protein SAMN05518849_101557 [Sphingobium sp. AP50]|uniref:hypothetical protein n=1 Tax=Sphingobium sp. AP50 TaxID=1884369 RepID=UPI0008C4CC08|nr:hypothetical protein [Sphingobium sp. AP50]SEI68687.1 hypothetical protein SAMN05518849_101557 [Sphingobium sp. AP50]